MPFHDSTICENGHVLSRTEANYFPFCDICGAKTYSFCPTCGHQICGKWFNPRVRSASHKYRKPYHCCNCSEAFPWTKKIIDNAVKLAASDELLDDESKAIIKNAIPLLVTETTETPQAVVNFKRLIPSMSEDIRSSIFHLLLDAVCDFAKQRLF